MKFGKVDKALLNEIDFNLPEIHDETFSHLPGKPSSNPTIRFGATGWGTDEWKGIIYPTKTPKNRYLHHYAKSFDSIELNSTHYRTPKKETIIKWKNEVPETFRFCPKVLQYISHSKALGTDTDRIIEFCDAIAHFEDKLGITFMQLPPYWDISRLPILEAFLKQWPAEIPLAIEARHPSLFVEENESKKYFDLLSKYRVNAVITDVAGARYLMHLRINHPTLFVRFVGNDLHETDYNRLDEWIEKINELIQLGMDDFYFFPHQPENIKPPETTDYLVSKLKNQDQNLYLKEISWTNKDNQLLLF